MEVLPRVCCPFHVAATALRRLVARVAHVAMTTFMMKTISTTVYDLFFRK
jgi:hypothetical protein